LLLGHPHDPHAALADFLEELIRPNARAGAFSKWRHRKRVEPLSGGQVGEDAFAGGRSLQKAAGLVVGRE
jgi:hypothetical protein